jgi:hypothetical protein
VQVRWSVSGALLVGVARRRAYAQRPCTALREAEFGKVSARRCARRHSTEFPNGVAGRHLSMDDLAGVLSFHG